MSPLFFFVAVGSVESRTLLPLGLASDRREGTPKREIKRRGEGG
jgi:hypothetical protein